MNDDLITLLTSAAVLPDLLPDDPPGWDGPVPGAIVALSRQGRRSIAAFGCADIENGVPISARTVFDGGSLAKQFAAAVTLLSRDRADLDLDEPVTGRLPELGPAYQRVRIGDLLQHTSGIRDYKALLAIVGARRYDFYSQADVLSLLARQRSLAFEPGTEYEYSNSNYLLLGAVLHRVTGRRLGELCRSWVCEPLGLSATWLADDLSRPVPGRARSYSRTDTGFRVEYTPTEIVGDSGLSTTVTDLLTWGEHLLGADGGGDGGGGGGGEPRLPDLLRPGSLADGTPIRYGFGLCFEPVGSRSCVRHGGSVDGFQSEWLIVPDHGLVAVALSNWAQAQPTRAVAGIVREALDGRAPGAGHPSPSRLPDRPVTLAGDGDIWQLRPAPPGHALITPLVQAYLTPAADGTLRGDHEGTPITLDADRTADVWRLRMGERTTKLVRLPPPDEDPARYANIFHSAELMTSITVSVRDGELYWRRRGVTERLSRVAADVFRAGATWLRFLVEDDRVCGLRLDAPRARDIRFTVVPPGSRTDDEGKSVS
ncbi:beta-lactamase family protein [Spirillospora sp. NBC_00431]